MHLGSDTLDVAFLVHYSSALKRDDHVQMVTFMKRVLQYADMNDDKVRVGGVIIR